jgi:transcriptional regulator with XRE-family HTH domain
MAERKVQSLAKVVGANIAARRKQKMFTQAEFAEVLGMGADSLSRIEKGVVAPRFPRLEQIAAALECPVANLFRIQTDSFREHAESVADIIRPLTPTMQQELVVLLAHFVTVVKKAQDE